MENLTIVGMKELTQKVSKMERSLEQIAKALETLVKIENRRTTKVETGDKIVMAIPEKYSKNKLPIMKYDDEEDEEDE